MLKYLQFYLDIVGTKEDVERIPAGERLTRWTGLHEAASSTLRCEAAVIEEGRDILDRIALAADTDYGDYEITVSHNGDVSFSDDCYDRLNTQQMDYLHRIMRDENIIGVMDLKTQYAGCRVLDMKDIGAVNERAYSEALRDLRCKWEEQSMQR